MKNVPCHWCGRPAETNTRKGSRSGMQLCEDCCNIFDYYSDERECFVCGSRDRIKKMRKSGLFLCAKHRSEQIEINKKKAMREYQRTHRVRISSLAPGQKKEITKSVLCKYFSDLREREEELVPACVECQSQEDVVSVSTMGTIKLLCPGCRSKIYQRRRKRFGADRRGTKRVRTEFGIQCDRCEKFNARKVKNVDLYLCADHYREYYEQEKPDKGEYHRCENCGSDVRVRNFNGYWLCARHVGLLKLEKRKIPPLLRMFVIPYIRT